MHGFDKKAFWGICLAVFTTFTLIGCPPSSTNAIVPDLSGLSEADAIAAIEAATLSTGTITYRLDDTVPSGNILNQQPQAGTTLALGSPIALTVARYTTAPELVGLSEEDAIIAIEAATLSTGTITYRLDDAVPSGNILNQQPQAGTTLPLGSPIALTVARYTTAPDLAGLSEEDAIIAIEAATLSTGTITYRLDDAVPSGNILNQQPQAGTTLPLGSPIALTVARYTTAPDLAGLSEEDAIAAIEAATLSTGTITYRLDDAVPSGNILNQQPQAGTTLALGSPIALTVARYATTPELVGLSEEDAIIAIEAAGLAVATVTEEYNFDVNAGIVFQISPNAGTTVEFGTTVELIVSKGKPIPGDTETTLLPGDVPLEMVWIPKGTFMMGRNPDEQDSRPNEDPQHEVALPGFWMAKYELTKGQWEALMGTAPWLQEDGVIDEPDSAAVYISWEDAQSFITKLNTLTDEAFRLPSEAEWEYACRANTATSYYWGNDPSYLSDYAWWQNNTAYANESYAHEVGQKLPNAFGLYDMSGNVWEWCEDDTHSDYTDAPADGSAWVDSPRGLKRVGRGGCWSFNGIHCRSAYRTFITASGVCNYLGFRLVR